MIIDTVLTITEQQIEWISLNRDITVLPADDPRKLRLGWRIIEWPGIVIISDWK